MYLQSICIYIIIELKVYNNYVKLSFLYELNNHSNCKNENDKHNV